jgi:hypothetical protein
MAFARFDSSGVQIPALEGMRSFIPGRLPVAT